MEPKLHLCDENISIYKRDAKELIIFPSVPKWIMLEDGGSRILKELDGKTYNERVSIVGKNTVDELIEYGILVFPQYEKTMNKDVTPLLAVWFNITSACNLKCKHCFIGGGKNTPNELSVKEMEGLFDSFLKVQGEERIELDITGGEPLIRKDLIDILELCKKYNFKTRVITNGLLLTPDLCVFLANNNIPVLISLDGPTAEFHDAIRGVGTFDKTCENIRIAVSKGVSVALGMTLYSKNQNQVDSFISLAKNLNVSKVNFSLLNTIGNASDNNLIPADNYKILQHLLDLATKDKQTRILLSGGYLTRMVSSVFLPIRTDCCGSGINTCSIGSNGEVYPCPSFQTERFSAGNIRDTNFEKIWNESPLLKKFRNCKVINMNEDCKKCDIRLLCGGGCRGNATRGGELDFSTKNPRCDSVKKGFIDTLFKLYEFPVSGELVTVGNHLIEH